MNPLKSVSGTIILGFVTAVVVMALLGEGELNAYGYVLLAAEEWEKAISVFRLNTLFFPESGNVFDSLGEAYMKAGDLQSAVQHYMRSYQLDPANENAQLMIQEMIAVVDAK